jgi:hypothetical protein
VRTSALGISDQQGLTLGFRTLWLTPCLIARSVQLVKQVVTECDDVAIRCNKANGGSREVASPAAIPAVPNFLAYRSHKSSLWGNTLRLPPWRRTLRSHSE